MAHLVPRIPAILRRHHGLHIDLRLEDHLVNPVTGGIDIVIRAGFEPPDSAALMAQPLLYLPSRGGRVAGVPPGARRAARDAAALARHECLVQLGGAGPLSSWR